MRALSTSVVAAFFVVGTFLGTSWSADAPSTGRREAQAALKPYGGLVGEWRGSGQVQPGKAKGAWTEDASWAWKLSNDTAAIAVSVPKGKYLRSGLLKPGLKPNTYVFEATLPNGDKRDFTGKEATIANKKSLVLTTTDPGGEGPKRITFTPLHEFSRLIVLLEAQDAAKDYVRLGEVGYTNKAVSFAAGESGPICIVTEGRGSIPVSYKGKTYYVCCSGCKDLFNENPEAILAEAAQREKEKKK